MTQASTIDTGRPVRMGHHQQRVIEILEINPGGVGRSRLVKICCGRDMWKRGAVYRAIAALADSGRILWNRADDLLRAPEREALQEGSALAEDAGVEHAISPDIDSYPPPEQEPESADEHDVAQVQPPDSRPGPVAEKVSPLEAAEFIRQEAFLRSKIFEVLEGARFGLDSETLHLQLERACPFEVKGRLLETFDEMLTRGEMRLVGKRWTASRRRNK